MNIHGAPLSLPPALKPLNLHTPHFSLFPPNQSISPVPISRFHHESCANCSLFGHRSLAVSPIHRNCNRRRRRRGNCCKTLVRASGRESPYQVLGVSPSATPDEIKRAYRKLALKYHPDVNREANAQEKFMRLKHAYNTVLNSNTRNKYNSGNRSSDYSSGAYKRADDQDFYGFGDFFRDLQEEYRNWEATAPSQAKPKSLWEELSEIGEEFVEFLEKELNIVDDGGDEPADSGSDGGQNGKEKKDVKGISIEENIDEIEAALAQLRRELGL